MVDGLNYYDHMSVISFFDRGVFMPTVIIWSFVILTVSLKAWLLSYGHYIQTMDCITYAVHLISLMTLFHELYSRTVGYHLSSALHHL